MVHISIIHEKFIFNLLKKVISPPPIPPKTIPFSSNPNQIKLSKVAIIYNPFGGQGKWEWYHTFIHFQLSLTILHLFKGRATRILETAVTPALTKQNIKFDLIKSEYAGNNNFKHKKKKKQFFQNFKNMLKVIFLKSADLWISKD